VAGDSGADRAIKVDEAALAAFDPLVAACCRRFDDRLSQLFATILASRTNPQRDNHHTPLDVALAGVNISQLAVAVLGILLITGDYSTGMIHATFTAVPKRLPALWASSPSTRL